MAMPASTPKNFHDSIRNMFTGAPSSATSTNSLAYTLESSVKSTEDMLEMQRKHNNLALKIMQEQTKLLKKIAANDNGIGMTDVAGALLFRRMLSRVFGGRIATMLSGGIGGALATTITGIGKRLGSIISVNIGAHVTKAFNTVAAVGKSFKALSGIANAVTSSGVLKMVSGLSLGGLRLIPKLLSKLFLPLTAIMGIADAFSGWGNAESILGKANVGLGDRVASAIGTAVNGLLLGIPDWILSKFGGGNVSKLLASRKDLLLGGFGYLGKGIGTLIGKAISSIPSMLPSASTLLSGASVYVADKVYGTFESVKNAVWDGLTFLGDMIKKSITGVFTDTWDSVKNWWNSDSKSSAPSFRRSISAGSLAQSSAAAGASIGAMVNTGNVGITPGSSATSSTPSTSSQSGSTYVTPSSTLSNTEGGAGGALGDLVSAGESKAAGGYNAYNKGTVGNKMIGATGAIDLENMTIGEIQRRQNLPAGDENRLFAVGKYQMIPKTLNEAVTKYGLKPDQKFDKDLQERLFRDYLVGSKRPDVKKYIMGGGSKEAAQNALAYEFASFADPTGRGKYDGVGGNRAHIGPQTSGKVLDQMRTTYAQSLASGDTPEIAYAKAFGAGPKSAPESSTMPSTVGAPVTQTPGKTRKLPIDPRLEKELSRGVMQVLGEGYSVNVYSGGQPSVEQGGITGVNRTGTRRHDNGLAGDVTITGPDGKQISDEQAAQLAQYWIAKDIGSAGLRMRGGGVHLDLHNKANRRPGEAPIWNYDSTSPYPAHLRNQALALGSKGILPPMAFTDEQMAAMEKANQLNSNIVYTGKPMPGPGMGKLLSGNSGKGSLPTPTTGAYGSKMVQPYRSSVLGQDLLSGPTSMSDIVAQNAGNNPTALGPTPSRKPMPTFDSLIDKKTAEYKVPVNNPQTGAGSADSSGNKPTTGNAIPGSHSVTDIPVTDEYKMLLANGSAIT